MSELTIQNILELDVLHNARTVISENGRLRKVTSITTIEVADTSVADWVTEGQLCITALYSIRDDVESQAKLIKALDQKGCAGIIICHVGIWLKAVAEEVIDLCNSLDFPLIMPNPSVSFIDILNPVIFQLMQDDVNLDHPYSALQGKVIDIVINSNDIFSALKQVACYYESIISFFDPYGNCLFSNRENEEIVKEQMFFKEQYNSSMAILMRDGYMIMNGEHENKAAYLITAHKNITGILVENIKATDRIDDIKYRREIYNTVCALMINRKNSSVAMTKFYEQEYITDLLTWNFPSTDAAIRRGKDIGIVFSNQNCIMLITFGGVQKQRSAEQSSAITQNYIDEQKNHISILCNQMGLPCILLTKGEELLVMFNNPDNEMIRAQRTGAKICEYLLNSGILAHIGISNCFDDLANIPNAYSQARTAVQLGRACFFEKPVYTFKDVYFIDRIRNLRQNGEAVDVSRSILAPLREYDLKTKGELTKTLYYLLLYGGSVDKVTQKLYIHRNTLLNRKEKITEILGFSPLEMPYAMNLYAALEIEREQSEGYTEL